MEVNHARLWLVSPQDVDGLDLKLLWGWQIRLVGPTAKLAAHVLNNLRENCERHSSAHAFAVRSISTDSIVPTSKHSKESHHQTQDAHPVIVLAAPVNFGVAGTADGASRSKETGLSGPRHSKAINLASGVTRPNAAAQ